MHTKNSTTFLVNGNASICVYSEGALYGENALIQTLFKKYNIFGKMESEDSNYKIKMTIFPGCPVCMNIIFSVDIKSFLNPRHSTSVGNIRW